LRVEDEGGHSERKLLQDARNYDEPVRDTVREFYRLNHTYQTYEFVEEKRNHFLKFDKKEMPVWAAFDFLNQLVDDSDPDTDLDQFQHLLQTAEAIRADGHPDWMVLVGLIAVYVVSGHIAGKTDTMPLRVEKLFQEYNMPGAFAVASVLASLAVVTLLVKSALEWKTRSDLAAAAREASEGGQA